MGTLGFSTDGGSQPAQMDFSLFRKKSLVGTKNKQAEEHLKWLKDVDQHLKSFKHHEEFDRLKSNEEIQIVWEHSAEKVIGIALLMGYFLGRIYTGNSYGAHYSFAKQIRYVGKGIAICIPLFLTYVITDQNFHVINHIPYRAAQLDEMLYQSLDENVDLYRHVDDIKYRYNLKVPSAGTMKSKALTEKGEWMEKEIIRKYTEKTHPLFE